MVEKGEEDAVVVWKTGELFRVRASLLLGMKGAQMRLCKAVGGWTLVLQELGSQGSWRNVLEVSEMQAVTFDGVEVKFWLRSHGKVSLFAGSSESAKDWVQCVKAQVPRLLSNVDLNSRNPEDIAVGDLILFRLDENAAAMQRVFTGSAWDHIAMVVPTFWGVSFSFGVELAGEPFSLLEATPEGVILCPLTPRLQQYRTQTRAKFAVRQLRKRSDFTRLSPKGIEGRLRHLVTCSVGQKYTYKKLFKNQWTRTFSYNEIDEEEEAELGYFCSELCARALSSMGVMINQQIHPNAFWPKSFAFGDLIDTQLREEYTLTAELPLHV